MTISKLNENQVFKLTEDAYYQKEGFSKHLKETHHIFLVIKKNPTTLHCINENGVNYLFKFKGTNHWRSLHKDAKIKLLDN